MLKLLLLSAISFLPVFSSNANELDKIRENQQLTCGVVDTFKGFSQKDKNGKWNGFMPDICRVVAVGIFNDETKVKFIEIPENKLNNAVKNDLADIIVAPLPITFSSSVDGETRFSLPVFYDRLTIVAKKNLKLRKLSDLKNKKVNMCTYKGYPAFNKLHDYIAETGKHDSVSLIIKDTVKDAKTAYDKNECSLFASAGIYATLTIDNNADDFLADELGNIEYGIGVKENNERLYKIANWSLVATIIADDFNITSENIETFKDNTDPTVKIFFENAEAKNIGADNLWFYNIVKKIGNYSSIYNKNLGDKSPMTKKNHTWHTKDGNGIIYYPMID